MWGITLVFAGVFAIRNALTYPFRHKPTPTAQQSGVAMVSASATSLPPMGRWRSGNFCCACSVGDCRSVVSSAVDCACCLVLVGMDVEAGDRQGLRGADSLGPGIAMGELVAAGDAAAAVDPRAEPSPAVEGACQRLATCAARGVQALLRSRGSTVRFCKANVAAPLRLPTRRACIVPPPTHTHTHKHKASHTLSDAVGAISCTLYLYTHLVA
jgi:hypothetical protein